MNYCMINNHQCSDSALEYCRLLGSNIPQEWRHVDYITEIQMSCVDVGASCTSVEIK